MATKTQHAIAEETSVLRTGSRVRVQPSQSGLPGVDNLGRPDREAALEAAAELHRGQAVAAMAARRAGVTTEPVSKSAAAVKRAAGEYAVYDSDDAAWIFQKHPAPAVRLYTVDGPLAGKLLDSNSNNRPPKKGHLANIRADMSANRWVLTHQGIALSKTGELLDGQHRLLGIAETGKAQRLFVFVGMDPRGREFIDQHVRRSGADSLVMNGHQVANASNVAALVRFVWVYDHFTPGMWGTARCDNGRTLKEYTADQDRYQWAVRIGMAAAKARKKGYSSTVIGALVYLATRGGASEQDIDDFIHGYRTGEDLRYGSPILRLIREWERMREGHRHRPKVQFHHWVVAWNAFVEGRQLQSLSPITLDSAVPPITVRRPVQ